MKDYREVICCVIDNGQFMPVAECLAQGFSKVYYHTPWDEGWPDLQECIMGDGVDKLTRLDDFFEPEVFDEIDLFVFPHLMGEGLQKHLQRLGKAVWGSRSAMQLERMKGKFFDMLRELELPVPKHKIINGMAKLRDYLREHDDLYIKISKYRKLMDTWHHETYATSKGYLDYLALRMGPFQDLITFYVIDPIDTDIEVGIDNYCIDGQYPSIGVLGYEKKNKVYLATVKPFNDMPEEAKKVHEAMAPVLAEYQYRQFFSTEIRVKDDVSYFIDPTLRTASPAGEEQLELYSNFPEIVWNGAHGILVEPKIAAEFAGESLLVYQGEPERWKELTIPEEVRRWVKLYGCAEIDGVSVYPPDKEMTIGAVVGMADTAQGVIDHIKETREALSHLPVEVDISSFADLLIEIEEAEEKGIEFTDKKMPSPESVIDHE